MGKRRTKYLRRIIITSCLVGLLAICALVLFALKIFAPFSTPFKETDYLHFLTYKDYSPDPDHRTLDGANKNFGCSSVRNGNFYGRNFDFVFNDIPEFVVKINGNANRHASIGVATHFGLSEYKITQKQYTDQDLAIIPNFTLDGINDAGVIVSDNVVPHEDVSPLTGTNPNAEDIDMFSVPRYLLDHADSADHAVELLKNRNLVNATNAKTNLHYMIADANKTFVVEAIDNTIVAQEKTGDQQIMTNYYVNLPSPTEHAQGVERYALLKDGYDRGSSFDGMWSLLQDVRYSNAYRYSNTPMWLSELIPQAIINSVNKNDLEENAPALDPFIRDYWITILGNIRTPSNPAFWHTTHNSTYDIANRKLRVTVQEDYSRYFEFSL